MNVCAWLPARCLAKSTLAIWSTDKRTFRCPQHYCVMCGFGTEAGGLVMCNRCPVGYHEACLPPTAHRLNLTGILCPAHMPGGPSPGVRCAVA